MLFQVQETVDGSVAGWVLPDNPSDIPRVDIYDGRGLVMQLEANLNHSLLRDRGLHDTGMCGFRLSDENLPDFSQRHDELLIRENDTGVLIYRRFLSHQHIQQKLFVFDLRALPDLATEGLLSRKFTFLYSAVQQHPQQTFVALFRNPTAKSLYLSGGVPLQQYEQPLREHKFKIVALIRDPFEEMAERLLFARYAVSRNVPIVVERYMSGLEPLKGLVETIEFEDPETIKAAFSNVTDEQKEVLSNPLVKGLACSPNEQPKNEHIETALSRLSRLDLVGLRSRFGEFRSILPEVIGVDLFSDRHLPELTWVQRIADDLRHIKHVKKLISLDIDLYSFAEEAIINADVAATVRDDG